MRTMFYEELSALSAQVGDMCGLAADAMEHATQALLGADLSVAEQVIADHEHIAARHDAGGTGCFFDVIRHVDSVMWTRAFNVQPALIRFFA